MTAALHVAITGSTGMIGKVLTTFLQAKGMQVTALDREKPYGPQLEGVDIVVNLAGDNISKGRWTEVKKRRIRDSRISTTKSLVKAMKSLAKPPKLLVNASAIGIYGDRGEEVLSENSTTGSGFLASVCKDWEAAANEAEAIGTRVVLLRFGVVMSPDGGALKAMLLPFKLCLGGVVGSGRQWMSWIGLQDVLGVIWHVIEHQAIKGPVNVVHPKAMRNSEFTKQLGQKLGRPTLVPLPTAVAKLVLGEMAQETLLASAKVVPGVLESSGYRFVQNEIPVK